MDQGVMKKVIILGSSRKDGNTRKVADEIVRMAGWDLIDLKDYNISYYDYDGPSAGVYLSENSYVRVILL